MQFVISFTTMIKNVEMDAAYEKFRRAVFGWDRTLLRSFGHDVFDENWQKDYLTYILYVILLIIYLLITYTLIWYDNFTRMTCFFYFSLLLQVSALGPNEFSLSFDNLFSFLVDCIQIIQCTIQC